MSGIDSEPQGNVDPNLSLGDFRGDRYPNQFFDMAQQYMPPTIKELFRWCTFYYYNSPLIGSAIKKISRYPITDLIFEHEHESIRSSWKKLLVDELKLKDRLMEVNLDYHVYGNAFVSIHLPFTRFLTCKACGHSQPIKQWDWSFKGLDYMFTGNCPRCMTGGPLDVKDVPYKDRKGIRIIRWNPQNIHIKHNDYTGRYTYMYSVPGKLKNAVFRGDKDILEDIPLVLIEALRKRRMIRLNPDAVKHLKNPTLAEQDQGWGKPSIIHVLKDMYYFYTLRRAQEAIALEHIIPFDILYPQPNAQMDPFVHTDLGDWKHKLENIVKKHRRDPNYKAVIPIPVGFGRIGGDGKALMLAPELNYLTQTIVGGMGIPQEFLFGGLNFTGSSISLRTLENDFIQNRSQLLDLTLWIKDKIRIWMGYADLKSVRFADFRMADDVQRNQQLVGLNAQGKLSDNTMLTELGFDHEEETKKIIEELFLKNYIMDLQSKGAAKSQGEAQMINFNYQQKIQELAEKAQLNAQQRMREMQRGTGIPSNVTESIPPQAQQGSWGEDPGLMGPGENGEQPPGEDPQAGMEAEMNGGGGEGGGGPQNIPGAGMSVTSDEEVDAQLQDRVNRWASQLMSVEPVQAHKQIASIKMRAPQLGAMVEKAYNQRASADMTMQPDMIAASQDQANQEAVSKTEQMNQPNMNPLPSQRAATRSDIL